ncbi:glycosyltransferase [Candidatus Omnitrophota bacterium]
MLIWIIGLFSTRTVIKNDIEPTVIILTAAYNEEEHIEVTIRNKFEQGYPVDKLHYVVVSDASDDGTDEVAKKLQKEFSNLHFIRQDERQGKTVALNKAVEYVNANILKCRPDIQSCRPCESRDLSVEIPAQGRDDLVVDSYEENIRGDSSSISENSCILLFSDANSIYKPHAIKNLVRNFSDPEVGYVTGKMIYQAKTDSGVSEGCSAYMKYENCLRTLETRVGSIIGVDGGIDACRLELYEPMDPEDLPDFVLPLSVLEKGYRVVYESEAVIVEDANETHNEEFSMRVRVALRSIHAIWKFKDLTFNIFKHGIVSLQIISHKGFRYDVGWMQVIVFITNYFLIPVSGLYHFLFTLQLIFYVFAVCGYISTIVRNPRLDKLNAVTRFPYYLCLVNAASCVAGIQWLCGRKQVIWSPRK